ncbi:TonB-dependent receptor [Pyxidicoccus xibeiensis]|uniref:TonB-dependent receptor n=1 Tax=Pyxidicoccus xibeiensis TaxID=2906759 RepID=UPI0020A7FC22|nr:TonB-dependent receptor [Pyxidicoccus xibeiensis]MCP3139618.1 TonB-dependent receptor [Pyxidicoccus xibeiensis]
MSGVRPFVGVVLAVVLAAGAEARAGSFITGTVRDAQRQQPLPGVVVSAWQDPPSLQGELTVVTDDQGVYLLPRPILGTYTLRFEKEGYRPYARSDVVLRKGHSLRVDVRLAVDTGAEWIPLCGGGGPPVDTSSTSTVLRPDWQLPHSLPLSRPLGRTGAVRAADGFAELGPRIMGDERGLSIHGASVFENRYTLNGLSTTDAATGLDALPLSAELFQDVTFHSGGAMPESGRATGGVIDTLMREGSNELHGSVFATWAPGRLEGGRASLPEGAGTRALGNLGDFGATLGGRLKMDRLWFFAGVVPTLSRVKFTEAGSSRTVFADQRGVQALGRLTYLPHQDHNVTLSLLAMPTTSRGVDLGLGPRTLDSDSVMTGLQYRGAFLDKRLLVDVNAGWLRRRDSLVPVEGGEAETPFREVGRQQASVRATVLTKGLGTHVLAAGVDTELLSYERRRVEPGAGVLTSRTTSPVIGSFVQDSWQLSPWLTVNAGVRHDVQLLAGGARGASNVAVHQLSPRVGVVVMPWRLARVFANYAKSSGLVPLGLKERSFQAGEVAVDPDLAPTTSSEFVAGLESEVLRHYLVASATYTHRELDSAAVLLRNADGSGTLLGNPGSGLAAGLARPERDYDAVTVSLRQTYWEQWMAEVSYTRSRLRGNFDGPFSTVAGPVVPGLLEDAVPVEDLGGRRRLAQDRTHVIKAFGAREFYFLHAYSARVGVAYVGASGLPVAGTEARTPWVHLVDARVGVDYRLTREARMSFDLEVFNVLGSQAATRVEERATAEGTELLPVQYQAPREVRLGVRYVF